ncbi:MAG TPA: DNA polymerase III subunit delta [Ignavibacteria bacterium]|nr:DNA polymerase III subunit delta [Ignavibacteria bacterium]
MAKTANYKISYTNFLQEIKKGNIKNNYLIFCNQKVLLDELIETLGTVFIGENFTKKDNLKIFYSDENDIFSLLNECSNLGFFTDKKIVIYKLVKKPGISGIRKSDIKPLLDYFNNYNPDTILILNEFNEEYKPDSYSDIFHKDVLFADLNEFSETAYKNWLKHKIGDYKISDEDLDYFMKFMNDSYDDAIREVEKLKIYTIDKKEIERSDINESAGISRDFSESELIKAILNKDTEKALMIYNSLILRKDVEIYLLVLISNAFIILAKLQDPASKNLTGFNQKRALKLWYDNEQLLPDYKKYLSQINEIKLNNAFTYIYKTEKLFKTGSPEKSIIFSELILNLCNL